MNASAAAARAAAGKPSGKSGANLTFGKFQGLRAQSPPSRASRYNARHGNHQGVARQARRDRLEIGDSAGRAAAGHSGPPRSVKWAREILYSMPVNGPACPRIARRNAGKSRRSV